jgi:transcriptional regulator with XRE-family HTH domain
LLPLVHWLCDMPRASRLRLPPIDLGGETLGQRLARIRKERGYTQMELAERIGILQTLVTDYECDRLRLTAEMAIRFALALDVSMDELLKPKTSERQRVKPSRKVLRRLELIESLPTHQQQTVLKTIDTMLRGLQRAS